MVGALALGALVPSGAAAQRRLVVCEVPWLEVPALERALRAEATGALAFAVRGCEAHAATIEVGWPDGGLRERRVSLADVPDAARPRTLALLLADLASLGPATSALAPEAARLGGGAVEAGAAPEAAEEPAAADAPEAGAAPPAAADAPEAGAAPPAAADAPEALASPPAGALPVEQPADAGEDARSPDVAPARSSPWRAALDVGVRVFPQRSHPALPGATLELGWRWLFLQATAHGLLVREAQGRSGTLLTTGRLGVRPWTRRRGPREAALDLFGELGLVRLRGRAGDGAIGAVWRRPAVGFGASVHYGRLVGPLAIGVTARAGWLRGVVGTAVRAEPDGSLRTVEVGGAHGVFLGAALSLSLARPSIP
ncbi:MAG TPA: hypothetical protein RMH85_30085 [Polyangiaceae bacterium LLY-WYZ-15_(1-7)]|nr:hypothetical protein [Sandaracinus sp.]MBJ72940.1 hypothetical protein [Sandaracinus sp.]HJL03510.1 hypothetical protein [Polyangiaceae bacterium LLY-WYZ-15_(1-7)]HJL12770.1 hypothetical protein [Polyangiaceae bacterium LLY-WYZ-15_(1-7)]HJL22043.1 hypothetical protein [Polyangiaceae bacterium LLY-WYZ-15_(1-7)]